MKVAIKSPNIFVRLIDSRTDLCDKISVSAGGNLKREQLIRELQKEAKDSGSHLSVDWARGKGGHCVVRLNGSFTVIKSGEISPLMAKIIRKQLGL